MYINSSKKNNLLVLSHRIDNQKGKNQKLNKLYVQILRYYIHFIHFDNITLPINKVESSDNIIFFRFQKKTFLRKFEMRIVLEF